MKVRSGFVSNSSSSSFLLIAEPKKGFKCGYNNVELTDEQKEKVRLQGYDIPLDRDVYLTSHISDTSSGTVREEGEGIQSILEYRDGGHGGPYGIEDYTEIAEDIWLWKGSKETNLEVFKRADIQEKLVLLYQEIQELKEKV
jgi:hypothetical protein